MILASCPACVGCGRARDRGSRHVYTLATARLQERPQPSSGSGPSSGSTISLPPKIHHSPAHDQPLLAPSRHMQEISSLQLEQLQHIIQLLSGQPDPGNMQATVYIRSDPSAGPRLHLQKLASHGIRVHGGASAQASSQEHVVLQLDPMCGQQPSSAIGDLESALSTNSFSPAHSTSSTLFTSSSFTSPPTPPPSSATVVQGPPKLRSSPPGLQAWPDPGVDEGQLDYCLVEQCLSKQELLVLPTTGALVLPLLDEQLVSDSLPGRPSHPLQLVGLLVVEPPSSQPFSETQLAAVRHTAQLLAKSCAMELRAALQSASLTSQAAVASSILREAQRPSAALNTFSAMLLPRLGEGSPDKDLAKGIAMQGQRLKELLRQLDAALQPRTPILSSVLQQMQQQQQFSYGPSPGVQRGVQQGQQGQVLAQGPGQQQSPALALPTPVGTLPAAQPPPSLLPAPHTPLLLPLPPSPAAALHGNAAAVPCENAAAALQHNYAAAQVNLAAAPVISDTAHVDASTGVAVQLSPAAALEAPYTAGQGHELPGASSATTSNPGTARPEAPWGTLGQPTLGQPGTAHPEGGDDQVSRPEPQDSAVSLVSHPLDVQQAARSGQQLAFGAGSPILQSLGFEQEGRPQQRPAFVLPVPDVLHSDSSVQASSLGSAPPVVTPAVLPTATSPTPQTEAPHADDPHAPHTEPPHTFTMRIGPEGLLPGTEEGTTIDLVPEASLSSFDSPVVLPQRPASSTLNSPAAPPGLRAAHGVTNPPSDTVLRRPVRARPGSAPAVRSVQQRAGHGHAGTDVGPALAHVLTAAARLAAASGIQFLVTHPLRVLPHKGASGKLTRSRPQHASPRVQTHPTHTDTHTSSPGAEPHPAHSTSNSSPVSKLGATTAQGNNPGSAPPTGKAQGTGSTDIPTLLRPRPSRPLRVWTGPATLQRIAAYLVDLALHCAPRGGQVTVSVATSTASSSVQLSIIHTGQMVVQRHHPAARTLHLHHPAARHTGQLPSASNSAAEHTGQLHRLPEGAASRGGHAEQLPNTTNAATGHTGQLQRAGQQQDSRSAALIASHTPPLAATQAALSGSGLLSFAMAEELVVLAGGAVHVSYPYYGSQHSVNSVVTGLVQAATRVVVILPGP